MNLEINIPEKFKADINKALEILMQEGCKEVYIFGSLVTKEFREDSDIDIAIRGLDSDKFFNVMGKLMMEINTPFDLIDLDEKGNSFAEMIQKKGLLVRVA